VKMEVTGAPKAFDIASSTDGSVKIGDAITVLGNPEGAGVVKPVEGKILGIGPDLIEVDAQFVPGNSGSPIIHQATGKVLGVATYTVERKVNNGGGGVQTEVRRFGYRLDGVKQWEQINWKAFYAQSAQLTAIETLSEDFAKMMHDTGSNGLNLDPASYSSPALQRSIRSFVQAVKERGSNMSVADQKNLVESFISDLRSVSHGDIIAFNQGAAYDYFKREVADESSFRDDIYAGLTRALESVR
ncbi:MAG TPA: serine protease, partial [Chthoniobacteraceae bacterium]|nr:serine protease [Chthoniobacteraceae bacterium]